MVLRRTLFFLFISLLNLVLKKTLGFLVFRVALKKAEEYF